MKNQTPPPRWLIGAIIAIAILIVASCILKQAAGDGWDFQAYYQGAQNWLKTGSPYHYQKDFSFKYAPVVALPFVLFQLVPYSLARWIYAIFHLAIALSLPALLYAILNDSKELGKRIPIRDYLLGILVSFAASFRFIDSEFQVSQIGLWIIWILLMGFWLLQKSASSRGKKSCGLALMSFAALIKIHSGIFFLSFVKKIDWKNWLWMAGVFLAIALLPNPKLWLAWAEQIRVTTHDLPITSVSYNLQGFYPFGVIHLGMDQFGPRPLLLALPFLIVAWLVTPKLFLDDAQKRPMLTLLTISLWLLWGFMASPLPWQYTYSILWVLVLLSWVSATAREKNILVGIAAFLAVTPHGIIGKTAAHWLETRQNVFFAVLAFWCLLAVQARRLKETSSEP